MKQLRFGHISDMHLISGAGEPQGTMKMVQDAGGDPLKSLTVALEELSHEKLDFLIMTGDLCHEGTAEDYAGLRELLDKYLPGVPVMGSLGNHDVRDSYRKGFLGDNYGGNHPYCDMMEVDGLKIISVDSAWEKQLLGSVDDSQLDWLQEVLKKPSKRGSILLFHHPVCHELERVGMELSPRMERIIRGSDIIAMFSGHVHRICTGFAAGVLNIIGQSLAFDIEIKADTCDYTTRGGYNMCILDGEGNFFVDSRIASPKGAIFQQKPLKNRE